MNKPARASRDTTQLDAAPEALVGGGVAFTCEAGTPRGSLAFPSLCILPSGRWLATCRAAPRKLPTTGQHVLLAWSDDEGQSWSEPSAPFTPGEIDGKPGLFRSVYLTALGGDEVLACIVWVDHSDPDADFFNEVTEGLLDTRIFFARSADGGATWTEPDLMDTAPFHVPTPATGPVLLGENGEWICQFETNKHYHDSSLWCHSSVLMISRDEGKTWPVHSLASLVDGNRVFYWDQRPSVAPDGRVLDFFWSYDEANAVYLNIHAGESADGGRTWGALWDTGVPGQPGPTAFLAGGRMAMPYVDRTAEPLLKLRVSEDRGRSWPESSEVTLHTLEAPSQIWEKGSMQDAWAEMGAYSMGLPATAMTADGDVVVVFYAGLASDMTDVRWVRVKV